MQNKKVVFNLFSDGASFNNGYKDSTLPQRASYGYTICLDTKIICERSKDLGDNTISYAELHGALHVIKHTLKVISKYNNIDAEINLYSDSQFVIKSINEWIYGWIKKGWCSTSGPVQYKETWQELLKLKNEYNINFYHVKGHLKKSDFEKLPPEKQFLHSMNDNCDRLAKSEIEKFKATL